MATATRADVEVAERFLQALAAADWDAIGALLAPDVRLRALVPSTLRDDEGNEAVLGRFEFWWAALEDLRLLDSGVEPMANQVRVHYRLAGTDPDDGPVVVEQQCYFTVADGSIAKINSVCSGFQPADS
ncbi:MAG TPA: nuclear transport factor 2 family protein [Gaiellaceae bacterium]|nr:nuclear transport factor 2 family protein [Gaiellaceae bacterium]